MGTSDDLKKELIKLFAAELGGYFDQFAEKERVFLAEKAARIAEERLALELAADPDEIAKHKRLLQALALSIENEMIQLALDIAVKNRELLVKIVRLVISVIVAGR